MVNRTAFAAADLLSGNLHLHRFLVAELERCFAKEEWSDPEQLKNAFMALGNMLILRENFRDAVAFCLDSTLYPEIPLAQKFGGLLRGKPLFRDYTFKTGYTMAPEDKKGNLDYGTIRNLNDNAVDIDG